MDTMIKVRECGFRKSVSMIITQTDTGADECPLIILIRYGEGSLVGLS